MQSPLFLQSYSEDGNLVPGHVEEAVVERHEHQEGEEEPGGREHVPDVVVVGEVANHALLVDVARLGGRQEGAVLHPVEEVEGGHPADHGHEGIQDRFPGKLLLLWSVHGR